MELPHIEIHDINTKAKTVLKRFARSEIVIQALLVGLIAGIFAILFRISITGLAEFIYNFSKNNSLLQNAFLLPIIGLIGGLIAGILIITIAPETRGSGIPHIKLSLSRIGTGVRIRSIITKYLAGVAGIGTGLSLGREGPTVQLGAGAGAIVSKMFKITGTDQNSLIAAGAGAGIGATFNAPIAGTIFVIEELVHTFSSSLLFPTVIATVAASTLSRYFFGSNPAFKIPASNYSIPPESILIFIILGIFAGLLGVMFSKNIFLNLNFFDKLKHVPLWAKPAIAGFATGIAGLFLPFILGSGNNAIDNLLLGKFTLSLIILIFIGKFILTAFCFGSGAAGGIFLPILMLGSFLGYLVGMISNSFFGIEVNPVIISLAGMGAFLAAVARTPITAVVIVFEMTGDYTHILPLMLCTAIADLVAENLGSPPIYSSLIFKLGTGKGSSSLLNSIKVKQSMTQNVQLFNENMSLGKALEIVKQTQHGGFPIISKKGQLVGIITRSDIEDALISGNSPYTPIKKIMDPNPVTINPDSRLDVASFLLHSRNTGWLIVTDSSKKVLGILTRYDISKQVT